MKVLRHSLALAATFAVIANALPAQAKDNCNLVTAFTSKEGKGLRKLSIATTKDGKFDILIGKDRTVAVAADSCEIYGPLQSFELRCEWDFEGLQSSAEQKLAMFKALLRPCLAEDWATQTSTYRSDSYRVINKLEATLTNSNDELVEVELSVNEFTFDGVPSYDFDLTIERER